MLICIDDGSTNIKMAWFEDGQIKTSITPTSFKREWTMSFRDEDKVANYEIDGEKYSFDDRSAEAIRTTESYYQYSTVNVLAIHHALHQSGIAPQAVDIVVTLPLSEYLTSDNKRNKVNIEKKKQNVMRAVRLDEGEAFTVRSVSVVSESIPAGFNLLSEMEDEHSLLIVDVGGTSTDNSHVQAKFAGITKTHCLPDVGGALITDSICAQMAANQKLSTWQAQTVYLKHKNKEFMAKYFPNEALRSAVLDAIKTSEQTLINRVAESVSRFSGYSHVLCVGGPAPVVAPKVLEVTGVPKDRFYVDKNPQLSLVLGMLAMKQGDANE